MIVYDFVDYDLEMVIKDRDIILSFGDIKSYMAQLLKGVEALHTSWILHRVCHHSDLIQQTDVQMII